MCARFLGFVLLIWFPGVIRAQIAASVCQPPELNGGYFVPEQETYANSAKLIYACDHGLKPAAEGWWATSKCENGNWSPNPQCIDQKACLTPAIPNTIKAKNQKDWYETQTNIQVTCEKGYRLKDASDATCRNGSWSSLPVCERIDSSCSAPPKISNAVVINQGYREVFAAGSKVQYHCEDGYTIMGEDTILCAAGQWTPGPTCNTPADRGHTASAERDTEHEGRVEEMDRERVVGDNSGRQPSGGGRETTGHQGGTAGSGRQPSGGGRETTGHQGGTAGSGRQPSGGGSADTSGSNDRDSRPALTNIQLCGNRPVIQDAEVVEEGSMYLKYQCIRYYRRVGPETVNCYSDGSWSQLPTCEEAFCVMDAATYAHYGVKPGQREYMQEGETKFFQCTSRGYYIHVRCTNRRITLTWCCSNNDRYYYDYCTRFTEPN